MFLRRVAASSLLLSLALALPAPAQSPCDPAFTGGLFPLRGVDGTVNALAAHDGALFAGGAFGAAGDVVASRVARWDGAVWSALGSGMDGDVSALASFGGDLYAAGEFLTAGGAFCARVARWNGSAWSAVGSGTDAPVRALLSLDDGTGEKLYAAGEFTTAGGVAASGIAAWDGTSWAALGAGLGGGAGLALAAHDDGSGMALFVGGAFTTAGGAAASRLAKWDGTTLTWSALGSGANNAVRALASYGGALYAGGDFTTAGGASIARIARWDGSAYAALGSGANGSVRALAAFTEGANTSLFAGGAFSTAGGVAAARLARWNGSAFSAVSGGLGSTVNALAVFDDGSGAALEAGGVFTTAGTGVGASRVAEWDGAAWSSLGSGLNNLVLAFGAFDDGSGRALHAGGTFTAAGGVAADRVAKFDGAAWSPLGAGVGGQVAALLEFAGELVAAGNFTTAGGAGANRIARWNGAAWSALGTGLGGPALALAVFDDGGGDDLYAGGNFSTAGGVPVNSVARWSGAAWSALGSGMNGQVRALAVFDDGSGEALYAGGDFTTAGGGAASRIAKWNGSAWSALGSGLDNQVHALAVFDGALYAGGTFANAGAVSASRIARWDGSAWSAVGSGTNDVVRALAVFDDGRGTALFAGGDFTTAGGSAASRVARFDGTAWDALASGADDSVRALFPFASGPGGEMFVGGAFDSAGGAPSGFAARWGAGNLPSIETEPAGAAACAGGSAAFSVVASGTAPLSFAWRKDGAAIPGATGETLAIDPVLASDAGEYDVLVTDGDGCSRASRKALLTVSDPPSIDADPEPATACEGGSASFTAAASGTPPLSYSWRKGGVPIPGATGVTFTIDPVAAGDAGEYDVVVSNSCGSATSAAAALTVLEGVEIVTPPAPLVVCEGDPAAFSVAASGSAPLAYAWRKDGIPIPGATGASLLVDPAEPGNSGEYDVVVTNACGSVASAGAALAVLVAPSIVVPPASGIACEGEPFSLGVAAAGSEPLAYAWRKGGVEIPGETGPSFTIPAVTAADSGLYDVVVTNACGSATSPAAALSVDLSELESLVLAPPILVGGNASLGRVALTCPAPPGGALVLLSTTDPLVASVPPDVFVAEGSSEASFPIATVPVAANAVVTLGASFSGETLFAPLAVLDGSHDCLTGPGAEAAYFADAGTGTLDWSDGRTRTVTLGAIDPSALAGDGVASLAVENVAASVVEVSLAIRLTKDAFGAGGHLLEALDADGSPRSAYGFAPGAVAGTLDVRAGLTRLPDDRFEIVPEFRLPGGEWTLFDGLAFDTALPATLDRALVAVRLSTSAEGTLCFVRPAIATRDWRAGSVNAAAGELADVVFVNGSPGVGEDRVVTFDRNDPFLLRVERPPSRPTGFTAFVLYIWVGVPSHATQRRLPYGLGRSSMPTPVTDDGPPNPKHVWNTIGIRSVLGEPTLPSDRAPTDVLRKAGGLRRAGTFFAQGFIVDAAAPNGQAAVTNGVVLVSE